MDVSRGSDETRDSLGDGNNADATNANIEITKDIEDECEATFSKEVDGSEQLNCGKANFEELKPPEVFDELTANSDYKNKVDADEQNIEIKCKKRIKRIVDSDSEDESHSKGSEMNVEENDENCNENEGVLDVIQNYKSDLQEQTDSNDKVKPKKKPKRIAILDSESEEDLPMTPHNKSFNDELDIPPLNNQESVYVIDARGDLIQENKERDALQKSRLAALCDSESSEDENEFPTANEEAPQKIQNRTKASKRFGQQSKEKPSGKDMTAKQALQQRNEIKSESQRMLRESRVSLPYHKPKSHSIKEFLQNRPRLSLAILNTQNTPPSVAMKMSMKELEIVAKKMEEREKIVEEFYKSESESDTEDVNTEEGSKVVDGIQNENDNEVLVEDNEATGADIESSLVTNDDEVLRGSETFQKNAENLEEMNENTESKEIHDNSSDHLENAYNAKEAMDVDITEAITSAETNLHQESNTNEENLSADLRSTESTFNEVNISNRIEETKDEQVPEDPVQTSASTDVPKEIKEPNTVLDFADDSVDFDFNLDGLDDDFSEKNSFETKELNADESIDQHSKGKDVEDGYLQGLLKKYENNPDGGELSSPAAAESKISKSEILMQLSTTRPSLSGRPNEIIDFDESTTKPSEVSQLMERFMKHALPKNVMKHKVQLDVINMSQGEVVKETVAMLVDAKEEPVAVTEIPGVKLKKLRDELQSQMAQRRFEQWQLKHQPLGESTNKDTEDDEKSECGADDNILDDEEEAELTDIEEEDEEEYEDEFATKTEKPKMRSAFIDEEAEESGEEGASDHDDEEPEEIQDAAQEDSNQSVETTVKRPLKRILKGFSEDTDDEEEEVSQPAIGPLIVEDIKVVDSVSLNSTASVDEDDLPPNQLGTDKTPHKNVAHSKTDVLGLLTPVQRITGLQSFSGSKFLQDGSPISPFRLPPDPSPLRDKNWNTDLQKKLFSNSCETLDSQSNMEDALEAKLPNQSQNLDTQDMLNICSGSFPLTTESLATQDVLSMCSGSFPDATQISRDAAKHGEGAIDELNTNSAVASNKRPVMQVNLNSNEEIKTLDDDRLISQLLDEEEMEQFKKKFESPIGLSLNNVDSYESDMEIDGGGKLIDSSDDEAEEPKMRKSINKLQKRLAFSDDSDSDEDNGKEEEGEEEINLHDDVSGDELDGDANRVVDYDSEENEVVFENEEEPPMQNLKPSDFLENEAELSDSDWDSADEDEKGLDALEVEQGDADVFDENKMRSDLEKIHMRRVLDQDNHEIKILQELLLEDGELHGTGRQRQFRWKNIDNVENDEEQPRCAEAENFIDEEESEEQWRRMRHQREMFLKEKQEKLNSLEVDDFISDDSNSQVLKLGQVRKSLSAAPAIPEKSKPTTSSSDIKKPLMLLNTRGSFLARNDKFLTKLAEFTKVSSTTSKNAKKIVFQTVSAMETTAKIGNKRKSGNEGGTPKILKKLRLSTNWSPVSKNVDRKKKLFK